MAHLSARARPHMMELGNETVEESDEIGIGESIYYRQNRKGGPLKISREKYLRTDISCGYELCKKCPASPFSKSGLQLDPPIVSSTLGYKHFLLPDSLFVVRQIDVLEELPNVILLQIVMDEVFRSNPTKYRRLREAAKNRNYFYFLNEHHKSTYVQRHPDQNVDERNKVAFLKAAEFFRKHLQDFGIEIVILTDDKGLYAKYTAETKGMTMVSCEEYVTGLTGDLKSLEDKICRTPLNENEGRPAEFVFPPHMNMKDVQYGIKNGKYFQGVYRSRNFNEGFIRADSDTCDLSEVLVQSKENINRATEGDIVAFEILPESEWSAPSGIVLQPDEEENLSKETILKPEDVIKEELDDENESTENKVNKEGEEMSIDLVSAPPDAQKQKSGRVLAIIRRKWLPICGVIRKSQNVASTFHFFIPDNKKMPIVRIETRNVSKFENQKIVVQIDQWPITSRHPIGHCVKILGTAGTIETETDAILHEHGIPHEPFSKAVEACLPAQPYEIEKHEYSTRKDFRDILVVSVDPPGCTDIDDALHCNPLPDGTFEVGVHIADVSHYVKPETALDLEAAKRGTTVYLADRRIDMIPKLLSSDLCSLHSGTDKLVFSVIWKLSAEAKILETNFYKSVVHSKAALTYAEAQSRLNSSSTDEITKSLKGLSFLAQKLKKARFENGALMLTNAEVSSDGESEEDCEESHSMVEEFMLLANCSVAKHVLEAFREFALLRRHPVPPPANFEPLILAAKTHGINVVVDQGSKALNESIENQSDEVKNILRVLTTRCMTQAVYCCSGTTAPDLYPHFGLAVGLYTHFTSPIRRYADLMVHRLLAMSLKFDAIDPRILVAKQIHATCDNNNLRHRMAQYASRASHNLHKSRLLKGRKEEHLGYVMFVRRNALQVFVSKYGMEGFIFFPKSGGYLYNEKEASVQFGQIILRPLDKVTVELSLEEERDKVVFKLISPNIPQLNPDIV